LIVVVPKATFNGLPNRLINMHADTKRNSTAAQKQTKRNVFQFKEARRNAVESKFRKYVLEVDIDKLLLN